MKTSLKLSCLLLLMPSLARSAPLAPSEPVLIKKIQHNGSGCPMGTVAQNISSDNQAFTLVFSEFVAQLGPGLAPSDARRNCVLTLTLNVPAGWQYSVGSFYYRGFMQLDNALRATHDTSYFFEGQGQTGRFQAVKNGPLDENFVYTDKIGLTTSVLPNVWSQCGQDRALNINVAVSLLNTNPAAFPGARGLVTNDSVDGELTQVYGLTWRRCQGGASDAATRPVYRLVRAAPLDHLYTLDPNEGKQFGYVLESSFPVFEQGGPDRIGVRRCLISGVPGGHFLSTHPECEGHQKEALLGYLWANGSHGGSPVYRCNGSPFGIYDFLATSEQECLAAKYRIDGILGYRP